MWTIDTSVFIRAFTPTDKNHAVCKKLLSLLEQEQSSLIEPILVLVEIAGTISREFRDSIKGRVFAEDLKANDAIRFIALDDDLAQLALEIAADQKLRGADAVYVATALRHGTNLISLDAEHLTRAKGIISVYTPTEAIKSLP